MFKNVLRLLSAGLLCASTNLYAQQPAPNLDLQGDHFTIGGGSKYLIFVSYFDGLRASDANLAKDLDFLKDHYIDGIRVLPDWNPNRNNTERLCTNDGATLNTAWVDNLKRVLTAANQRGIVVDISFAGGLTASTVAGHKACIEKTVQAITGHRNALIDIANERDNPGEKRIEEPDVLAIRNRIKEIDPGRIVVASNSETTTAGTAAFQLSAQLDLAAFHDERGPGWNLRTAAVVSDLWYYDPWKIRVYLQEPTAYSNPKRPTHLAVDDDDFTHFLDAIHTAKRYGAAAWTFHLPLSFTMSGSALVDRLDPGALEFFNRVRDELPIQGWSACNFELDRYAQNVPSSGGTFSVTLTSRWGCQWNAYRNDGSASWVSGPSPSGGQDHSVSVSITVSPNTGGPRETVVTIGTRELTIFQAAPAACFYSVTPTSASVPSGSSTNTISVTAGSGCAWTATSPLTWLAITGGSSGSGSGTVTYSVTANDTGTSRAANLTVAGQTVVVSQAGAAATLSNPSAVEGDNILLTDSFDANVIDPAKWSTTVITGSQDTAVTVAATGQQLRITPLANTSGTHYNAVSFATGQNLTGGYLHVRLLQAASGANAYTMFGVARDNNNYYRFYVSAGTLAAERRLAGTKTVLNSAAVTLPVYLRLRHSIGSGAVVFETAPVVSGQPGTWTTFHSEPWDTALVPTVGLKGELKAGTSNAEAAPGYTAFDDFYAARPRASERVLLDDSFDTTTINAAKWTVSVGTGTQDPAIPVSATAAGLQIGPLYSGLSGSHYNGVTSVTSYDLTGGYASTQAVVLPSSSTTAYMMLTVFVNGDSDHYRVYASAGSLFFEKKVAGTKTVIGSISLSAQTAFWRIRHDALTDRIVFETAPLTAGLPGEWTARANVAREFAVTALRYELKAGTSVAESSAPGSVKFDAVRIAR